MAEPTKIGSSEWFSDQADKLINFGLDVLRYKTSTGTTSQATGTAPTTMASGIEGKLPWILGGLAVVGIVFIMVKR